MKATLETETQIDQTADVATDAVTDPSVRVVETVADAIDADPLTLDPLYDVIDPDALDQLVDSAIDGYVSFEFCEQAVTVHGDGTVVVEENGEGGA